MLSLPLPDGLALCLCCPWGAHDDSAAARRHTRATSHPTVYRPVRRPSRPPEPEPAEVPEQ